MPPAAGGLPRIEWSVAAAMVLLFVLPFPGTVALRLLSLLAVAVAAAYAWRALAVPPLPFKGAIGFWVLVALVSVLYATDPAYSLGEIKSEVGYSMLAFVAFFALTRDEARLRLLCTAVAAGLAVIVLAAILTYGWKGAWELGVWYGEAPPTTHYLLIAAPAAALGCYLWMPRHLSRALVLIASAVYVVAILTGQRAVWLGLGVQALVAAIWLARAGRRAGLRIPRVAAVVVSICLLSGGLYATELFRTSTEPWAAMERNQRIPVWKGVVQRIAEQPLTGAGFGRKALLKAHPDLIPAQDPLYWHAHNIVLNYGLSAGIPGMLAIVLLFAAIGRRFWAMALGDDETLRVVGLAGAAIVAGIFARNLFNDFFVRDGAMLFWALSGALLGFAARREAARPGSGASA